MDRKAADNRGAPHHNQRGDAPDQQHSNNLNDLHPDTEASRDQQQAATREAATQKLDMDEAQRESEHRLHGMQPGPIPARSETVTDPIDQDAKDKYPRHATAKDNRTLGIPTSDERSFDESAATAKDKPVVGDPGLDTETRTTRGKDKDKGATK